VQHGEQDGGRSARNHQAGRPGRMRQRGQLSRDQRMQFAQQAEFHQARRNLGRPHQCGNGHGRRQCQAAGLQQLGQMRRHGCTDEPGYGEHQGKQQAGMSRLFGWVGGDCAGRYAGIGLA